MALLTAPLKQSSEVDLVRPLKNFIKDTFSDQYSEGEFTSQLDELNKLRKNAVCRKLDQHTSSLDLLSRYYDQLVAIENKLPITEGQVTINFCWYDAFNKGGIFSGDRKQTASSGNYEKTCVLYNIAAMQSQIAALQNQEDDEGLKSAAKYFQQAAGIFKHLTTSVFSGVQQVRTYDIHPDTLTALSALMQAQAQESFLVKARQDKMKDGLISKIAIAASDLYTEVINSMQITHVKAILPREWIPTVTGKQALMHAYSEYHQAKVCSTAKSYGEEIARLRNAINLLREAEAGAGGFLKTKPLVTRYERELAAAEKDNNLIYNDRIPQIDSLKPPGSAQIAKALEPKFPISEKSLDLFETLVPLALHNAVVAFENKKLEIINREVGKLRENTQLLNTVLASLNLPASIEDLAGDKVPSSLLEKSNQLKQQGGITSIDKLFQELPELLQRNTEILNEAIKLLDEEGSSDKEMREKFKEKWTRHPSDQLTAPLRAEGGKYRTILNNAIQADSVVREKFQKNREFIDILSGTESKMASSLPAASAASALKDSDVVGELRTFMNQVEAIKNEREVLESEIKNATCDIRKEFVSNLSSDGVADHESTSDEHLDSTYNPFIQQVQESSKKQELLLNNIQDANTRFSNAKQQNVPGQQREEKLRKLASAFDVYMELTANLKEGTKFYNDLTQLLVRFQGKVSDFCFARKTEKEELLRDLTMSIANQPSGSALAAPAHHADQRQPPGRPPPRPPPPAVNRQPPPAVNRQPPTAPQPAMAPPPASGRPPVAAPRGVQPYITQQYQPTPSYAPYGYAPMPQPFVNYQGGYQQPPQGYPQPPQGYPAYSQQQYNDPYGQPFYGYQPPSQ